MDTEFKQRFIDRWREYFPGADLPIAFYYTDWEDQAEPAPLAKGRRCVIIANLTSMAILSYAGAAGQGAAVCHLRPGAGP